MYVFVVYVVGLRMLVDTMLAPQHIHTDHPPTHKQTHSIQYISLFNYLNGALQKNELEGLTFEGGLTGEQVCV